MADSRQKRRRLVMLLVSLGLVMLLGGLVFLAYQQYQGAIQAREATDPPLTPYPHGKFIKPRWIK